MPNRLHKKLRSISNWWVRLRRENLPLFISLFFPLSVFTLFCVTIFTLWVGDYWPLLKGEVVTALSQKHVWLHAIIFSIWSGLLTISYASICLYPGRVNAFRKSTRRNNMISALIALIGAALFSIIWRASDSVIPPQQPIKSLSLTDPKLGDSSPHSGLPISDLSLNKLKETAKEIDNQIRLCVIRSGRADKMIREPADNAFILARDRRISQKAVKEIGDFFDLERSIITNPNATTAQLAKAESSANEIIKALAAVSLESHLVLGADLPLYFDDKGQQQIPGVIGVMLQATATDGTAGTPQVFPTTNIGYYKRGMNLTWEWSPYPVWGKAYFRDTEGNIQSAFDSSMTFIGRDINETLLP
jgi:hypothetical protein